MCILGGSPRESRREKKEEEEEKKKKKKKKNKKGRRRQSHKTEAACVARFAATTYWPYVYQISTAPSKAAPGTMYYVWASGFSADRCMEGDMGERLPQGRLRRTLGGSLREEETKTEPQIRSSLSSKCVLEQPMERISNEYWSISTVCVLWRVPVDDGNALRNDTSHRHYRCNTWGRREEGVEE